MHNPAEAAPTGVPRPNHLRKPCDGSCHNCHKRDRRTRSDRAAGSSRRFWPAASTRRRCFQGRIERTRQGQPAAHGPARRLGDRQDDAADALATAPDGRPATRVVLTMAYPQSPDQFLAAVWWSPSRPSWRPTGRGGSTSRLASTSGSPMPACADPRGSRDRSSGRRSGALVSVGDHDRAV